MKLVIENGDITNILEDTDYNYPKYTKQIINLANQNSQGTRPKIVGQMSELIHEFEGNNFFEWKEWYLKNHPDSIDTATDKIMNMIESLKNSIDSISRDMVNEWVKDLVIVKSYTGLKVQEVILKKISLELNKSYKLSTPEEESKGIDGYIDNIPVSIKPITYKSKYFLNENINSTIIFYEKKKDGIHIELKENELNYE
jgi:hypothetical protein